MSDENQQSSEVTETPVISQTESEKLRELYQDLALRVATMEDVLRDPRFLNILDRIERLESRMFHPSEL